MISNGNGTSTPNRTFIPAKPKIDIYGAERIFRVCAYCRVSTDNDAQLSSFELQQAHYGHDRLTDFLETVLQKTEYDQWFFGHYHDNRQIGQHILLYEQIIPLDWSGTNG